MTSRWAELQESGVKGQLETAAQRKMRMYRELRRAKRDRADERDRSVKRQERRMQEKKEYTKHRSQNRYHFEEEESSSLHLRG